MKQNYRISLNAIILCVLSTLKLCASHSDLSFERNAVVATESNSSPSEHTTYGRAGSISMTSILDDDSPLPNPPSRDSLTNSVIQTKDLSYWVRAWGLLCRKAGLDAQVINIGGDALSKIGQSGDQRDLMTKFKKSLDSVCQGDEHLKRARAHSVVALTKGKSQSKLDEHTQKRHEKKDKENVQEALQVLIKMLSVQNQALNKQIEEQRRLVELKEQELTTAAHDRKEDKQQERHNRICTRFLTLFSIISGTANVVLAANLAK